MFLESFPLQVVGFKISRHRFYKWNIIVNILKESNSLTWTVAVETQSIKTLELFYYKS